MTARLRLFRVIVLEFRCHKNNSLLNVIPWHIVLDHTFISLLQSSSCLSRSACCLFPPPTSPPHQTEPSRLELVIVANYKGDSGGPVKQNRSLSIEH